MAWLTNLQRRLGLLALTYTAFHPEPAPPPAAAAVRLTLDTAPVAAIDPRLFGVNYVWHLVPATEFARFEALMREVAHASLLRYPGGWAAERYDWDSNAETAHPQATDGPGVAPDTFLDHVALASFVSPSAAALRDPGEIAAVAQTSARLVRRFGSRVRMWEIGNEWWLQRGAKGKPAVREENLERYAALLGVVAPAMKQANPGIELYATADWVQPDDVATLRRLAGPAAWAAIDGISIHPYCGTTEAETLCRLLPERAEAIRRLAGKTLVFASEWALGPRVNQDDFGIRNANQMVGAFALLARARLSAAAYWPPARGVPAIALLSADCQQVFATGLLFGWMAQHFRGQMLTVQGGLPAVAARGPQGVGVVIPSMGGGRRSVELTLAGTGLHSVAAASVMVADDPDDPERARLAEIRPLPTAVHHDAQGAPVVTFDLNPALPGRGAGWEIAQLNLQ